MTKTIFTREQVKEFSDHNCFTGFTTADAIFPWLPEYFFMGYCPCDTGDGDGQ
jgi:predicted acyltransferase